MKIINLLIPITLISVATSGQISDRIDSIASVHEARGFNGNILYSKNDTILFAGNYGFSDLLSRDPLNDSTIFELASCSKQFTALAIVQLIEKGMFTYDTQVSKIIKNFPYDDITIEHLLRHQSGLSGFQDIFQQRKNWNPRQKATNEDVVKVYSKLKMDLEFEPGTKYKYSNTGYVILASIIEHLSSQSYQSYIKENIFIPAGMSDSRVQSNEKYLPESQNIAGGYTYQKRLFKKNGYYKVEKDKKHAKIQWLNTVVGNRGVYSSILDMEKWKKAFRYNKLISESSKQKMISIDSVSKKYGYGFAIYETKSKGKWVYHNGSWSGYKTMALYLPESNEYLLILSNNRYSETYWEFEEDFYDLISKM